MSDTGSVMMLGKTQDREKLVTTSDNDGGNQGQRENDGPVYNDKALSRRQPWRSRYPTPRGLKEQLARHIDGAQNV